MRLTAIIPQSAIDDAFLAIIHYLNFDTNFCFFASAMLSDNDTDGI